LDAFSTECKVGAAEGMRNIDEESELVVKIEEAKEEEEEGGIVEEEDVDDDNLLAMLKSGGVDRRN